MVVKPPPIKLIETYLHKEEQQARLLSLYDLTISLLRKQVAGTKSQPPKSGHAGATTRWGTAWSGAHLRPMYRTVHRTKPREMVLRAIRWVNPERMFPIMSWDKAKLASLSREEFEEAFAELAKIRREAHVISNRYDQMLDAIKAGQLPYHIPYANINYMSLQEHKERATRLGQGAEDWGHEIDVKAEEFRQQFEGKKWEEGHLVLDNIDSLWEDGAPPFMRTRGTAGRWRDERLMRARRQGVTKFDITATVTDADNQTLDLDFTVHADDEAQAKRMVTESAKRAGKSNVQKVDITDIKKGKKTKLPTKAKVWQREFVDVPEIERRPGEEVRIPKGNLAGQIRIPSAKPGWMSDSGWKQLQQRKKGTFGPKDNKIEITSTPLDFYDTNVEIALRREQRWTQRGLEQHRGAASQAIGGHGAEGSLPTAATPPQQQETPEQRIAREEAEARQRKRQQATASKQQAAAAAPDRGHTKGNARLGNDNKTRAIEALVPQINDWVLSDSFEDPDLDIATHFKKGNIKEAKLAVGGVLNQGSTLVLTDNDDKRWLFKLTRRNENVTEMAVQAIDRAFGFNITPRIIFADTVDANVWEGSKLESPHNTLSKADKNNLVQMAEEGKGHIGEWINDDAKMVSDCTFDELRGTISTKEQRERWYAVSLLDAISGNWDSWGNNLMFRPDKGVFSIDNGLAFAQGVMNGRATFMQATGTNRGFAPGQGHIRGKKAGILRSSFGIEGFSKEEITQEIGDWFDESWDGEAIVKITQALGIEQNPNASALDSVKRKEEFTSVMIDWLFDDPANAMWDTWKSKGTTN